MVFRGRFQVLALAVLCAFLVAADFAMAQPGGRTRGTGGSMWGQVSQLNLLGQEAVQKELELVSDQVDAIKEAQDRQREMMREVFMGARDRMQGLDNDERQELFKEIQEEMKEANSGLENEVMEELLPHQISRLKQLYNQAQTNRSGGAQSGSMPNSLVEDLGLTEEQLKELKEKAAEVSQRLKEKVAKLQAQAQDEIFSSVLTKEQLGKYEELMGDKFEFPAPTRGNWGRSSDRGSDRGGDRGSDRGGDRGSSRGSDF
ncbi:MAG: hypothetical protein P8R31_04770 [Mariniblastus sp.]|nr:hypothetical protein [Mariniblastus sp.]